MRSVIHDTTCQSNSPKRQNNERMTYLYIHQWNAMLRKYAVSCKLEERNRKKNMKCHFFHETQRKVQTYYGILLGMTLEDMNDKYFPFCPCVNALFLFLPVLGQFLLYGNTFYICKGQLYIKLCVFVQLRIKVIKI